MQRCELITGRYRLPVMIFGDGTRTLVCVNGAQQTMGAWGSVMRRFVASGYRVVLFDFPNQGSAETQEGPLGLIEQAEVLDLVLRQVSPEEPVDLLAGSWGALVAAACAARYPASVRRLILGSFQVRANAHLRRVAAQSVSIIERGARGDLAELVITEFGSGLPGTFRQALRNQFAGFSGPQLQQVKELSATLASGAELLDLVDLRRVSAQTLIVNGGLDPLVDAADRATTADCFPRAELRVLEGVGHFLHLEQPSVIDVYLEFAHRRPRRQTAVADAPELMAAPA
jgi:pimeloyl-ACP methyl ester carboxylesterase